MFSETREERKKIFYKKMGDVRTNVKITLVMYEKIYYV